MAPPFGTDRLTRVQWLRRLNREDAPLSLQELQALELMHLCAALNAILDPDGEYRRAVAEREATRAGSDAAVLAQLGKLAAIADRVSRFLAALFPDRYPTP